METSVAGNAEVFRYTGDRVARLDVFIYPQPRGDADIHETVASEVESFKQTLPGGILRGWYEAYRMAFEMEEPVQIGEMVLPGRSVAIVFRKSGYEYLSIFYLHAYRGLLIKVRLTVPFKDWESNPALQFSEAFLRKVVSSENGGK